MNEIVVHTQEKGSYKEKTLKMLKRIIVYEKMRNK
jgi:hypothetical protein